MKKIFALFAVAATALPLATTRTEAQNIQIHYDIGREAVTSTVEMFRPDGGGSTFFFIDFDYTPKACGAYFEISREICFWQKSRLDWLSAHIEYNGGLSTSAGSFNNAWLAGATYSGHSEDFSKTWSLTAAYKAIPGTLDASGNCQMHNFQITGVWNLDFFNHWLSFNGFFDFWREMRPWQGTEFIFMAEPQVWVNLRNIKGWEKVNLSVGTEVELSANFVGKGFHAMPTIAAKWTF
ncbi:MAG: DUF5020 family protein [Bacteroidales bacterium]|nr:DUF5020 family protein [Bacteroidales bacterium]